MLKSLKLCSIFGSFFFLGGCAGIFEALGYVPSTVPGVEPFDLLDFTGRIAQDGVLPTIAVLAYKLYSNLTFKGRLEKAGVPILPEVKD
jgi:hypothetical protein